MNLRRITSLFASLIVGAGAVTLVAAPPASAALPNGTLLSPKTGATFTPGQKITLSTRARDTTGKTPGVRQVEWWLYAKSANGAPTDFTAQHADNIEGKIRLGITRVIASGNAKNGVFTTTFTMPKTNYINALADGDHVHPIAAGHSRRYVIPPGTYQLQSHMLDDDWFAKPGEPGFTQRINVKLKTPVTSWQQPAPNAKLAVTGRWQQMTYNIPARAIHTTVLNDGRVLLIAGSGNSEFNFNAGSFTADVWNPTTGTFKHLTVPEDMFCSGHAVMPDGRVLIMGGTKNFANANQIFTGLKTSYIFDPKTDRFAKVSTDPIEGHWYPTLVNMPNGDIFATGGYKEDGTASTSVELYSQAQGRWLAANEIVQTSKYWGTYPSMFLLANGKLFYDGAHTFDHQIDGGPAIYDVKTGEITPVPGLRDPDLRDQAGSVLLPPAQDQRVAVFGGGYSEINATATNTTDLIDLKAASPAYTPGPDMPGPGKMYVNSVTLPDRTVLETGGSTNQRRNDVKTTAIFNPANNTWRSVAADQIGRSYHSSAVLLKDGRVVVIGSNPLDNTFEFRISVYEPPYMFKGARPVITKAPTTVKPGATMAITYTTPGRSPLKYVSLLKPMSVTHQMDSNMRLVDVPVVSNAKGVVTVRVPDSSNILPPGPYFLAVTDAHGVPSVLGAITVQGTAAPSVGLLSLAKQVLTVTKKCPPNTVMPCCSECGDNTIKPGPAVVNTATEAPGGCLKAYGQPGQCLPAVPPSAAEMNMTAEQMPWTCTEVHTIYPQGITVQVKGSDPLRLDRNSDGVACGTGDGL